MWSELVQAYESKLAVLEEARAEYSEAMAQVINQAGPAMEAAVEEGLGERAGRYRVEATLPISGSNASFALAPWSCITIADDEVGTEIRIAAWVSSSWGGPAGLLRVVLSLERVHGGLDRREWVAKCSDSIAQSVPGEPFEPRTWKKFSDISSDWPIIRVASLELVNQEYRQTASEAHSITLSFIDSILPTMESIRDAGIAMALAEGALMRYRPALVARAAQTDDPVYPARGLGPWQGGRYLQVGSFWLATNPDANELLAAAKNDEVAVRRLAQELCRETTHRGGRLAVTLLGEEQLRGSADQIDATIARAYDVWFDSKSSEPTTADDADFG